MKKQYTTPSLKVLELQLSNMIATSLPVTKDPTDDEARSKAFWGPSIFEEDEDNEDIEL